MKLLFFMTFGMSLDRWIERGLFDREKQIYEELLKRNAIDVIYWVTYGSRDVEIANGLKKQNKLHYKIEIIKMPKIFDSKIGKLIYSFFIPFLYYNKFKKIQILKTNQMMGSWTAVFVSKIYNKPLLLRTGYTLSIFSKKQQAPKIMQKLYESIEKFAYKNCTIAIVSSNNDKYYLLKKYNFIKDETIKIIPNYIDTELFKDFGLKRKTKELVFVGRLSEQKNLFNLISAVSKTNFSLDIYGKGELEKKLREFVAQTGAKVTFKGVVPNKELPAILNCYQFYILPSYYEGMPKTLLEAMACGCVCIGTNVEGINEVIQNEINGYLINDTDNNSIENFLKSLSYKKFKHLDRIKQNGIRHIRENYSLESITKKEINLIKKFTYDNI